MAMMMMILLTRVLAIMLMSKCAQAWTSRRANNLLQSASSRWMKPAPLAASSSAVESTTTAATHPTEGENGEEEGWLSFTKYHGLGNDFILVDNRQQLQPSLTPQQAAALCDRNRGVGGDGVIFALQAPPSSSHEHDYAMRIFNSDGSEPEMCGNGIRCLARFLHQLEMLEAKEEEENLLEKAPKSYQIHTLAGTKVPVLRPDGTVTVDMGEPILKAAQVPTTLTPNAEGESVVQQTMTCRGKTFSVTAVSMGNPHAVIFVNQDVDQLEDFELDGPALMNAPEFPARTNVEFVQVLSPRHLKMRVWERGAGPTLACGTGACALTVAALRAGQIPRPSAAPEGEEHGAAVRVTLPGGDLWIEWREADNHVYMTGPATMVFTGRAVLPPAN